MRRLVSPGIAVLLAGCIGFYAEVGAGAVVGAVEPDGITAGPVLEIALGIGFEEQGGYAFGLGIAGNALPLQFDDFDPMMFGAGIDAFLDVPISLIEQWVALRWNTSLTLGSGGPRRADVVDAEGFASLFTGPSIVWMFNPQNRSTMSFSAGPYGAFFSRPGAFGGPMLRVRLTLG